MILAFLTGCNNMSPADLLISKNLVAACMKVPMENMVATHVGAEVKFEICRTTPGDIFVCAYTSKADPACVGLAFIKDPWVRPPVTPEAN